MPETPKKKSDGQKDLEDETQDEDSLWEKDQKQRRYYYDDAYGYETYEEADEED